MDNLWNMDDDIHSTIISCINNSNDLIVDKNHLNFNNVKNNQNNKGGKNMENLTNFLKYYTKLKKNKIADQFEQNIQEWKEIDPIYKIITEHKEQLLKEINQVNDIPIKLNDIIINCKLLTNNTRNMIKDAEEKRNKEFDKLDKKIEMIKNLCSLTTKEDKIFEILYDNNIITDNNSLNI